MVSMSVRCQSGMLMGVSYLVVSERNVNESSRCKSDVNDGISGVKESVGGAKDVQGVRDVSRASKLHPKNQYKLSVFSWRFQYL